MAERRNKETKGSPFGNTAGSGYHQGCEQATNSCATSLRISLRLVSGPVSRGWLGLTSVIGKKVLSVVGTYIRLVLV